MTVDDLNPKTVKVRPNTAKIDNFKKNATVTQSQDQIEELGGATLGTTKQVTEQAAAIYREKCGDVFKGVEVIDQLEEEEHTLKDFQNI